MPQVRVSSLDANLGECANVTVVEQFQIVLLRFADQQMKMLGHDHVSHDDELVPLPCLLQELKKEIAPRRRAQQRPPMVTATGDEMEMSCDVVAFQAGGCLWFLFLFS